jgi:hypothetical protein
MKYLALAVLLVIMQAATPVPRKAATSGSHDVQRERNVIVIREPTSTSIWEKSYVVFTGLLVFVGAVGIGYAIKTLQAVQLQAEETAKATQAMRDNVAVFVKTQGPQVAAKGSGNHVRDLADAAEPRVNVALVNLGTTTAYECTYETWIELLPFPFVDFTSAADYAAITEKFAMYPNHEPVVLNIPIRKGLTKEEREDMFHLRKFMCFRVRVVYRDVFSKTPERYADFGFYALKQGFGFLPKYNDSN